MWASVLTGAGSAGFFVAMVKVGELILSWWKERKEQPRKQSAAEQLAVSSAVQDAATANAVNTQRQAELSKENERIKKKISDIEATNDEKDEKIYMLESSLSATQDQLTSAQNQLYDIANELLKLKS